MNVNQLDVFERIKIYMHYYISISALNIQLDTTKVSKHNLVSFEDFCSGTDSRVSETLCGHYYRFVDDNFTFKNEWS